MTRILLALALLLPASAFAHPLAPALLQLHETAPAQYDVLWRTSISRAQRVDVEPRLPPQCRMSELKVVPDSERDSLALTGTLDCAPEGLAGKTVAVDGLDRGLINVIVRIQPLQGETTTTLLDAQQPQFTVPAASEHTSVFGNYLQLGFKHLLLGFDHILFVMGLVLLVRRLKPLLVTVTAFTAGHSLTLALATLGLVHVNQKFTEVGIALSILMLACEVARPGARDGTTLFARLPWLMAACFGLLHGLGFAGALAEVGLPQSDIPLALFAFNVGIEGGQLVVVAGLLSAAALWRRLPQQRIPQWAPALPVYVMGSLAAYWCLERAGQLL